VAGAVVAAAAEEVVVESAMAKAREAQLPERLQ
jgi:hypothetical protein